MTELRDMLVGPDADEINGSEPTILQGKRIGRTKCHAKVSSSRIVIWESQIFVCRCSLNFVLFCRRVLSTRNA
jgi:hypothetical protein